MAKTNKNRRKSQLLNSQELAPNSPIDFLNIQFSLQRFCFVATYTLCTNTFVVYSCCVHPFWTLLRLPCEMQSSLFKFLGIGHSEASENSGSFVVTATSHKSRYCRAGTLCRGVFSRLPFTGLHCKGLHKNKEKGP